jgi:hypothetical protein
MSNPDTTGANIGGIVTLAGFIAMIVILIFSICDKDLIFFDFLLYGGLPMLIYVLMFIVLYISKPNTDVKNAVLSAVPTVVTTYLALFISYISYFRIPIASVFAPLFLGSVTDIVPHAPSYIPSVIYPQVLRGGHKKKKQAGGACCNPIYSLHNVEEQFPMIEGISYGFYLFFAICFGGVFGSSMPSV